MSTHLDRLRGMNLALLASSLGLQRRYWLWIFREPDFLLRRRMLRVLRRGN